ncbi:hypothetical protein ACWDBO_38950 [Streptomyces mirabilis]|uniref:hypothetical protein n=1 Tax=Streptomyces TaxID=1883 RepID=UPI0029A12108|nr:hypothetical protein [Streptomyces sp. AK02-04a]MDX3762884.1 hypothetical protein [Streptomyces sp. AK02-04a]
MNSGPRADELSHDVEQRLRHEVRELWDEPDIMQMTGENVDVRVVALLFGIEHDIDPRRIAPPAAHPERTRRPAQRGKPVTAILRAFRLAQGLVLDRLLEELPRLTSDTEPINAATRKVIALATEYTDRTPETGVLAFQPPTPRHHPARPARLHLPRSRYAPDPDTGKPWAPVLPQAPAPTHPCPRWSR